MTNELSILLEKLEGFLEKERRILIDGRYAELDAVTRQKQDILKSLEAATLIDSSDIGSIEIAKSALEQIRKMALETARLHESAIQGARMAREHVQRVAMEESAIGAYSTDGSPLMLSASGKKRAL